MKYFIVLCLLFSGCATVSQYNQGCQDGVSGLIRKYNTDGISLENQEVLKKYCDRVESEHNQKRQDTRGKGY